MSESLLIPPPGRQMGCLPRTSKPGEFSPFLSDEIDQILPRQEWPEWIGKVDLRRRVHKIKDQDGVGSCATESTSQAIEIDRDKQGLEWVELNPWFIYYHTSGGRDQGSTIDGNLRFVRDKGVAPESVWPRSNGWRQRPSAEAYEAALNYRILEFYDIRNIDELGTALLSGFPVVFGWQGHSCVLTKLLSTSQAEYANSWSPSWGDAGYGKIALADINFQYGAWAVRAAYFTAELPTL